MTEFDLRKWARSKLRVQWTFEERADSELTLRSATQLDFDDFDFALADIEVETRTVLPILNTVRHYSALYRAFTNGVCVKLLHGKLAEDAENVKLGNDDFSKSYTSLKNLTDGYERKYFAALEELEMFNTGMATVVQRSGFVYGDNGENETEL